MPAGEFSSRSRPLFEKLPSSFTDGVSISMAASIASIIDVGFSERDARGNRVRLS